MRLRPLIVVLALPMLVLVLAFGPACGAFSAEDVPADGGPPSGEASVGVDGGPGSAAEAGEGGSTEGGAVDGPRELASGFKALSGITATETDVYFVEQEQGGIHAVPLDGSVSEHLVMATAGSPRSIALVGSVLYWCDVSGFQLKKVGTNGNGFSAAPADPTRRLVELARLPSALAVLTQHAAGSDGTVIRVDLDFAIATAGPMGFSNPVSIATRGAEVFWSEGSNGAIGHSADGVQDGPPYVTGEPDPGSIAVDANGVYWASPSRNVVRAKIGPAPPFEIAPNQSHPTSLASDGENIYWITSDGFIRRRPTHTPGGVVDVASGFQALTTNPPANASVDLVRGLAVTSRYVVWLTGDGKVMRAPK